MNQLGQRSVHTPLTPLTPTPAINQSPFDFSPDAIARCLGSSKTPIRTFSPEGLLDMSTPNVSPIDFLLNISNPSENKFVSPCLSSNNWNSSLKKNSPSVNINDRRLDVSAILVDIELKEYSTLFAMNKIDLDVFLSLNDNELIQIGVENELHRETLLTTIATFNQNN